MNADLEPKTYRAEALVESLQEAGVAGKRLLLLRASRGREVLAEQLTAADAIVEQVVVYESVDVTTPNDDVEELWRQMGTASTSESPDAKAQRTDQPVDWVTVTSSAIARSVSAMWGDRLANVKLASISPITSQTLRELGHEPAAEATEFTMDGLIDAILRAEQGSE